MLDMPLAFVLDNENHGPRPASATPPAGPDMADAELLALLLMLLMLLLILLILMLMLLLMLLMMLLMRMSRYIRSTCCSLR